MPERGYNYGTRSPFLGARDELLEGVARRDARRMQEEDRQLMRDRIAQQDGDRARALDLQNRQLKSIDEDRDMNRKIQGEESARRDAEAKRAQAEREARAAALDAYTQAVQNNDEAAIKATGILLLNMGGKTLPAEAKPRPMAVGENSTVIDPDTGKVLFKGPGVGKTAEPANMKDDPALPLGTKRWLESIAQRGVDVETARAELSKGWGQQTAAHPRAALPKAVEYLHSLFPSDGGIRTPLTPPPAAAPPAASGRASGAGPVGGGAPVALPQPPAAAPQGASDPDPDDRQIDAHIAAKMSAAGRQPTPEAIAKTKAAALAGDPRALAIVQDFKPGGGV